MIFELDEVVDTDCRADKHDEQSQQEDAQRHDAQVLQRDELGHAGVVCKESMDSCQQQAVGHERGNQAYPKTAQEEGTTDEAPAGTHQLHGLDNKATTVERESDSTVDERNEYDEQQPSHTQQDDGNLVEVSIEIIHQVLLVVDIGDASILVHDLWKYPGKAV